ncbi:MAG: DUF362 domain-containing protein [Oscillospiraceae bacterium]|nr:DUF362 domain-containing protein [Oscillospiraceae bacterium]
MAGKANTAPAAVACANYNAAYVRRALEAAVEAAGGLGWVRPGMRIGIKLNLCAAKKPEAAATTHPVPAAELTCMLRERGAEVVLGDSPGGPFTAPLMRHLYDAAGLRLCEEAGGVLNRDFGHAEAVFPEGKSVRSFEYCDWLRSCDAVINFCKLKSHGLMGMTAAVKNLYGVIPGTVKSEYHYLHPDPADFADMLVDLNEFVRPRLSLVDAVEIMEGNGPTAGAPRHMGLILAGTDPYRLDRLCAALLGVAEREIPYLEAAKRRGLLAPEDPELVAEAAPYALRDFRRSGATASWFMSSEEDGALRRLAKRGMYAIFASRPAAGADCTGCGNCVRGCPASAIRIVRGRAEIDRKKCVRCFCCQEFCPTGAMKAKRSAIARLTGR